jgi:hypothetical protein
VNGNGHDTRVARVQEALNTYLADNPAFLAMETSQQVDFYRHALDSGLQALDQPRQLATQGATDPTRMRDAGEMAGNFLEEVDFPEFVKELVVGTYDSIVKSTIEQMQAYTEMYKALAEPLGSIAKSISDADALTQVAADDPMKFTMGGDGEVTDNDTGMVLDRTNSDVQQMMYQAKLALAKERRLLLRETMLMGVQRLVVDKGVIKAGLVFSIKATEQSQAKDKTTDIQETRGQYGGSAFGLFGGGKTSSGTKVTVSTRQLQTNTEMAAQVTGSVELQFRSDVFKLDNFAGLFGDDATKQEAAARQGAPGAPGAPPAAVPARV